MTILDDNSQLSQNSALTIEQRTLFEQCKAKLDTHLRSFVEAGLALTIIRDYRLYRETYNTFEDFCSQEYSMTRRRVDQLIAGAEVIRVLSHPESDNLQMRTNGSHLSMENIYQKGELLLPSSERAARPLTKLKNPAQIKQAWNNAIETSGGKPTAEAVEQAVQEIVGFKPKSKSPSGKKGCDISRPSIFPEDRSAPGQVPEELKPVPFTSEVSEEEEAEEEKPTCNWNRSHGQLEYHVTIADGKVAAKIECNARSLGKLPQTIVAKSIEALEAMPEKENRITELTLQVRALVEENATLNQVVQEKDTQIQEFKQAIAQRDSRLAELEEAIAQKPLVIHETNDPRVAELEQALAEKPVVIYELDSSRVAELEQTNAQKDDRIAYLEEQFAVSEYYATQASLELEQIKKQLAETEQLNSQQQQLKTLPSGKPQPIPASDSPNLKSLIDFFDAAATKVQKPTVKIFMNDKTLELSRNSVQYPGALNIRANGGWVGRIAIPLG